MSKKKLIFVSTGRCGTTRMAEILRCFLPKENFTIIHQVPGARIANVLGNIMYYIGSIEWLNKLLYEFITKKYQQKNNYICTDPLVAMIIPEKYLNDKNILLVYVKRDNEGFSSSFCGYTREKWKSFIGHNFVPFWQPGLWPLENFFSKNIDKKYEKINLLKENFFKKKYKDKSCGFLEVSMKDVFQTDFLEKLVYDFFRIKISIPKKVLSKKSNQTRD